MAHIFKYSVLMAIPNPRRGERVNIGVIVFLADRLDIRTPQVSKLRLLAPGRWDDYVSDVVSTMHAIFENGTEPEDFLVRFSTYGGAIQPSELGWFSVTTPEQYEGEVECLLSDLVIAQKEEKERDSITTINAQIAREFKKARILARAGEGTDDHKVHRNYHISPSSDLRADFLLKNGVYHVTSTLDLRRESVHISQATWKAVVLYEARKSLGDNTRRVAVYAAAYDASQFRPRIGILKEFADQIYNWADPDQQRAYKQSIFDALRVSLPPGALNLG